VPVGEVASALSEVGVQSHVVTLRPVVDLSQLSYVDVLIWTAQSAPVPAPAPAPTSGVTNPATTVPPVVSSPASPGGGVSGP